MSETDRIRIDFYAWGTDFDNKEWRPPRKPQMYYTTEKEWSKHRGYSSGRDLLKRVLLEEFPEVKEIRAIEIYRELNLDQSAGTLDRE